MVYIWFFFLYNIMRMRKKCLKYTPAWFITLTFKGWRSRDDVEIAAFKFLLQFARYIRGHIQYSVGYEYGINAHIHMVIYWKEFNALDVARTTLLMQWPDYKDAPNNIIKLWPHGRVDWDNYDEQKYGPRGVFYVNKHIVMEDANEVICGSNTIWACRNGRCEEREKVRVFNRQQNVVCEGATDKRNR